MVSAMNTALRPTKADKEQIQAIVHDSGSSFYWAMRMMPKDRREAIFALYALARELDDIADEPGELDDKTHQLNAWKEEIEALYQGSPNRPITRALLPGIQAYKLDKTEFLELIAGMETDVNGPVIAPSTEELALYCRRVAGTIGLLSLAIFGRDEEVAKRFSLALSNALQLTNILRDLAEDAAIGRLYLPRDVLQRHGIEATVPAEVLEQPEIKGVCKELADQAEASFKEAEAALKEATPTKLRPAIVMMAVYHEILRQLKRRGWQSLTPKVSLSRSAKAWIALRHMITAQP